MLLLAFNVFIYILDKIILPTVITIANAEMRAKSMEIIHSVILSEYSQNFNYDDIIRAEKDNLGNITMLKADTLKMNMIASDVAVKSQVQLKKLGTQGIKVPVGYITKNNILAKYGPKVSVNMDPIGYIETKYESIFESAGMNQTRHKIYIQVFARLKIVLPMKSDEIEVKAEIPIAETIIVGKIPDTSINMDLNGAGFKLNKGRK
jgi:sporulation protein YunB